VTMVGDRAVVLGGSVTGMFAVSALAEGYREVIVVDRDELIGVREARRGSPQARHINGCWPAGRGRWRTCSRRSPPRWWPPAVR